MGPASGREPAESRSRRRGDGSGEGGDWGIMADSWTIISKGGGGDKSRLGARSCYMGVGKCHIPMGISFRMHKRARLNRHGPQRSARAKATGQAVRWLCCFGLAVWSIGAEDVCATAPHPTSTATPRHFPFFHFALFPFRQARPPLHENNSFIQRQFLPSPNL
jgi:hypothetical protein